MEMLMDVGRCTVDPSMNPSSQAGSNKLGGSCCVLRRPNRLGLSLALVGVERPNFNKYKKHLSLCSSLPPSHVLK